MPRKTCRTRRTAACSATRFNEAAARCRGKRGDAQRGPGAGRAASMRPRPDAAENTAVARPRDPDALGFNEAAARCRGKRAGRPRLPAGGGRASMRPRPDAAENVEADAPLAEDHRASMRPRPDAAENERQAGCTKKPAHCFNEAAARCRGKHVLAVDPDDRVRDRLQ